ncbi:MAG: alpha/beta hydrolase [Lachnospiraceae bacterium]|nr:alpha/beta hydrolase [Lachnospiraceae bacterium]
MSIRFQIASALVKASGMKKLFALPQEELLEKARKMNRKRDFQIPTRKQFRYTEKTILGQYSCLKIETQSMPSKRALLFFFGGGHILGPDDGDVKLAEKFGKASGRDVWFPYYPLCTDHCVKETFEMAYETYRQMLREYAPENIAFIGFSSGAVLALGVCLHNNVQPEPLPMPGLIIASSPGSVPFSNEERKKMAELSPKDILVDAVFMTTVRKIMEHGESVPDYMLSGVQGDFTNFPMTHFYYGSHEVLYAEAPYFAKAFEKYGAPCAFHIGKGLCHCYPSFDFYPEGKQAQEEIIGLLRKRE